MSANGGLPAHRYTPQVTPRWPRGSEPASVVVESMWGTFGKPLKRTIWNTLGLHAVLTTCLGFSSVLDNACVACCLILACKSSASHQDHLQRPVLIRDDKIK